MNTCIRTIVFLSSFFVFSSVRAQIGGKRSFYMLDMPVSARATSQGSIYSVAYIKDASLTPGNPALLNKDLHKRMTLSFVPYFGGAPFASFHYIHSFKFATLQFGTSFMNYGKLIRYDELGNDLGRFSANDIVLYSGIGTSYKERFKFGLNQKLVFSQIESYSSIAMAFDFSGMYVGKNELFSANLMLTNIGFQMKTYTKGKGKQELLPMDVRFGISQTFKKLPFRINITAYNFTRWDIRYDDPNFIVNNENPFGESKKEPKKAAIFFDNLFRHLIIGGEFDIKKVFHFGLAYNHLRRQELKMTQRAGLAGFSFGLGLHIKRIGVDYAYGKLTPAGNLHHITLQINLGERIKRKRIQKED